MEIIFIILAIIASVSGFFKDKDDNPGPDTRMPGRGKQQPRPSPAPSTDRHTGGEDQQQEMPQAAQATIEEQQQEQRRQLAERMNTAGEKQENAGEHDAIKRHDVREPENELSLEQRKAKKQMNNNLTRTGVINGVIMSEVLGSPRAVKPYRSVIAERKK
ncbi:hypothetical protein SAMN05216238_102182 [Lentibacillus persicus]|uniref:Uncharacterized protein n=1 Tax=Lentibacillus persicus TaxID=640948 RepID=A0A1I1T9M1_9BACI|nr:hypothetical protein [Lentibacillus persicus]SFD55296.1 hypothetical protein SAMN05216238_102182 [Lentibacillus persicus]